MMYVVYRCMAVLFSSSSLCSSAINALEFSIIWSKKATVYYIKERQQELLQRPRCSCYGPSYHQRFACFHAILYLLLLFIDFIDQPGVYVRTGAYIQDPMRVGLFSFIAPDMTDFQVCSTFHIPTACFCIVLVIHSCTLCSALLSVVVKSLCIATHSLHITWIRSAANKTNGQTNRCHHYLFIH